MSDEYVVYLPHINVNDGKTRVMNNLSLYMRLLGKFNGRQMTDELLTAIKGGDSDKIIQGAHALRGTAGNLGFPVLLEITEKIELLCKAGEDSSHLCEPLNEAMIALDEAINKLTTA